MRRTFPSGGYQVKLFTSITKPICAHVAQLWITGACSYDLGHLSGCSRVMKYAQIYSLINILSGFRQRATRALIAKKEDARSVSQGANGIWKLEMAYYVGFFDWSMGEYFPLI